MCNITLYIMARKRKLLYLEKKSNYNIYGKIAEK